LVAVALGVALPPMHHFTQDADFYRHSLLVVDVSLPALLARAARDVLGYLTPTPSVAVLRNNLQQQSSKATCRGEPVENMQGARVLSAGCGICISKYTQLTLMSKCQN
jgi:hypothetical protein